MQSSTVASLGMLMVLEIAPGDERLCGRHHADVALDREVALAVAAARIGAVEHRVVLGLQMRGAFDGHRAADMDVGGLDLAPGEAQCGEQVDARISEFFRREAELGHDIVAQRPLVERELDVEGGGKRLLDFLDRLGRESPSA